jgi:Cof subfamily protein (haloacid dehalogenase superfamily)
VAVKLLVLDIDGTIAGKSNQVSDRVKAAVAAARSLGVNVAIATGRMYASALRFHREIGANAPLMAYQGAWIQDPTSETVARHVPVNPAMAIELIDYYTRGELKDRLSVQIYADDKLYASGLSEDIEHYVSRSKIEAYVVEDLREIIAQKPPTKVLAMSGDLGLIQELMADLKTNYSPEQLHITTSVPEFLEVTGAGINKGTAIDFVAREIYNIDRSEVMAIGDNHNDLEAILYAGIGIAMGNAPQSVKDEADWVTTGVDEDGVAVAIEKFIL